MASEPQNYDPRFHPAFQRGYPDGGGTEPPARVPAPPPARVPEVTPPPVGRHAEPREADDRVDAAAPSLAGNPWVRVLWVAAPVLTVGGIAAQVYAQQLFSQSTGVIFDYVLPSLLQSVSPWVVAAGLASGVGVTLLHAIRWRPKGD